MSYVDQSRRPSPAGITAVIGVHVAVAALLVTGLTVTGVMTQKDGPLVSTEYDLPVPPPPPEKQVEPLPNAAEIKPAVTAPEPKFELKPVQPQVPRTPLVLPPLPTPQPGLGVEVPKPTPAPSFPPVGAKPRNNPGQWLTNSDYRPAWIRRELTGLATFRLEIAANGKVTDCAVTGSTGHGELDAATCKLVMRRARFEPARGSNGEAVAASYTGSVLWQVPD